MAKTTSKSKTNYYAVYKSSKTWEKNRTKRLERTIKNQPNNEQAKAALKGGLVYRRKNPVTKPWSASWVRVAKLFKEFTGSFYPDIMSSNKDAVFAAMQRPGKKTIENQRQKSKDVMQPKDFFTLGARIYGNR